MTRLTRGSRAALALLTALPLALVGSASALATEDPAIQDGLWYYTVPGIDQIQASGTTGAGVTVAIIDSTINPDAPDLVGTSLSVRPTYCDWNGDGALDPGTSVQRDAEHATAIAGLIVGTGTGAGGRPGTKGVAPGVTLLHYASVFGDNSCSDLPQQIDAAVADGADIINMSFAGAFLSEDEAAAIARAERAGVVLVAASNNRGGSDLGWPASANGVISVEDADVNQQLTPNAVTSPRLSVVAPGVGIRVPLLDEDTGAWDVYGISKGSSYAAAWVSGVIALAWSAHPDATGNQMIQALLRTTGQASGGEPARIDDSWGYGTVSVRKLIALDPTTLPDVNPLVSDAPDAQPAYDEIVRAAPTSAPTATQSPEPDQPTAAPTRAVGTESDEGGSATTLLVIGGALVLLAIGGAVTAAVILNRRNHHPNAKGA